MATVQSPIQHPPKPFREKLKALVGEMALEAIGTFLAILLIAAAHWLLALFIGADRKFFGVIPVEYVFDAGHLSLLGRLIWRIFRKFNDE